jgi:hypothetical protein
MQVTSLKIIAATQLPGDHFRSPQVPQIRARHRIELRLAKERVSNTSSRDVVRSTLVAQQEGGPVYGIDQSFHVLVIAFQTSLFRSSFTTNEPTHSGHSTADSYRQPIFPAKPCVLLKPSLERQVLVPRRDRRRTRVVSASLRSASAFPLAFFRVVQGAMIPTFSSSCDGATAGRMGLHADLESRQRESLLTQGYPEPANK